VGLVRAGRIDLSQFDVTEFGLEQANEAVAHAAEHAGPFRLTVLRPGWNGRPLGGDTSPAPRNSD
jgi:alcohol dehydrogenase